MVNSLEKYIEELKSQLNESVFSPHFTRLANLYYLNGQYEECADICKTGLDIYPYYLTAKIILLKALIKLEYLGDAENLLNAISLKIKNYQILNNYRDTLSELKKLAKQEKINYPTKISSNTEYEEIKMEKTTEAKSDIIIDELLNLWSKNEESKLIDKIEFKKFEDKYNNYKLKRTFHKKNEPSSKQIKSNCIEESLHFLKIKMVTETFADLLAGQGFYKEAFNIYNSLMDNENANKKRLLEKLTELERNFI
jgi:tetratricopeptide (TPR) repeat protein